MLPRFVSCQCGVVSCATMDFTIEMDEVKKFLRSKTYPVHVGNDKGKKLIFEGSVRHSQTKTTVRSMFINRTGKI